MEDRHIFERLYKAYYMPLYCFARGLVNDEEECRDLVNAAFEGVWRHYADIEESTVKAYLYRAVRNNCINHLSHQSLERQYADYMKVVTRDVATEDALVEREERALTVRRVLDAMDPTTREILSACYVEGKKYKQVAEERGVSVSTVKKHMVMALRIIREAKMKKVLNA